MTWLLALLLGCAGAPEAPFDGGAGVVGCTTPCFDFTTSPRTLSRPCTMACIARGCPEAKFPVDQYLRCARSSLAQCPDLPCVRDECAEPLGIAEQVTCPGR